MHTNSPWLIAIPIAAALTAGGCATGGAGARPTLPTSTPAVPAAWTGSAAGVSAGDVDLTQWWQRFGDDTLSTLVARALAANTDLKAAQARLREARAQRLLAAAQLAPRVTGAGSAAGTKREASGATGSFSAGVDASWEPDVFGGRRADVRAAEASARAVEADLHNTQVLIAAEVATNYVQLRGLQVALDIAHRNEAAQAETLQLTEWRRQAGLASSVDVEQARTSVEQTRAQIPTIESSITQNIHRLGVLGGEAPTALYGLLSAPGPLPGVPDAVVIGIPADTLRQRPDLRAAEQRVVAAVAQVDAARAARYPSFSLGGSIGVDALTGAVTGGTSFVASLVGSVAQTIFDGGRIREQIAITTAAQEQSVASYEGTVLTALEDVENALVSFEKYRQRLASLEQAQDAARMAAQLAKDQYTAGLADFQRVIDTERTVLSVEDAVVTAQTARINALVQLYKALGGGWTSSGSTPAGAKATAS